MRPVAIIEVTVDPILGLAVVHGATVFGGYSLIYREANRVRWDHAKRALYMIPRDDGTVRTPLEAFRQIALTVQGLGEWLTMTEKTVFTGLSDEDRGEIMKWHTSHQRSLGL